MMFTETLELPKKMAIGKWRKQNQSLSCRSWQTRLPKPCFPRGFRCALGYLCSETPKAEKLAKGWEEKSSGRPRPNRWALSGLSSPKQPFHPCSGCPSLFFQLRQCLHSRETHTRTFCWRFKIKKPLLGCAQAQICTSALSLHHIFLMNALPGKFSDWNFGYIVGFFICPVLLQNLTVKMECIV